MADMILNSLVDNSFKDGYTWGKDLVDSVQGITDALKKLESYLSAIRALLVDAEEKGFKDSSVKDWLAKLQYAAWDAEDILDTYNTKACLWERKNGNSSSISAPNKVPFKLKAAQKIKGILARIDEIVKEKENLNLEVKVDYSRLENRLDTVFVVDESDVVGRETDTDKIVTMLLSNEHDKEGEICVLPISGIGGLGKTKVAQLVFNDERVKGNFSEYSIWVSVTKNFNLKRIIREMLECCTKREIKADMSLSQLETRFLGAFKGKRFLLVLDDVWTKEGTEWKLLLQLLKQGDKKSRVLITSRMIYGSDRDSTLASYTLGYLPPEPCWEIFEKIVFLQNTSVQDRNRFKSVGHEIISKCGGLPLAVKAMAGILRGNLDLKKWQDILKSETLEVEEQFGSSKAKILPALKLSYDHLPFFLKRCFSYCSIFPKSYIFDKMELVKLWMAENYILMPNGRQKMENIGISYFDELVMRSFFQPLIIDDRERFEMHDLIHELSQSISIAFSFQVKDEDEFNHHPESRYVSIFLPKVEKIAKRITEKYKKVHTLLLPGNHSKEFGESLEGVFKELKCLRVLDLSSSTLVELPSSIGKLKLLRYLDLSLTNIKELPESVCKLYNLQTLKLLGCGLFRKLPHELINLVNLQYLELDPYFWYKRFILPPHIGNLTNLQNLLYFEVSSKEGCGIGELKNMPYLSGSLHISKLENAVNASNANLNEKEELKTLTFEWSFRNNVAHHDQAMDEKILQDLQPYLTIERLKIFNFLGSSVPEWIGNGYLQYLVTLVLKGCVKCKTLSLDLPCLRRLSVKAMEELENLSLVNCEILDTLNIRKCPKLNNLPRMFLTLRVLKITSCNSLTKLPIVPSLMFLVLIENQVLKEWNEVRVVVTVETPQGHKQMSTKYSFVELMELEVVNCPKIKPLPESLCPQRLEITGCELLRTLPPPEHAVRLEVLNLHDFAHGELVKAIPHTDGLKELSICNISNFSSMLKWPSLPNLNSLSIHGCKDLLSLSEEDGSFLSLSSLKSLSIKNCPKLKTLPKEGLPTALELLIINMSPSLKAIGCESILKNLSSLKELSIEKCPELKALPENGLPTALQHLKIQDCPLLAKSCSRNGGSDWAKIMHVPNLELDFH